MRPIAFIGMPGSGKSTVARLVAAELGFDFFDSDAYIERKLKMTIPQIFERRGESAFRAAETTVIAELCTKENAVLSLGGGAVLFNEAVISERCLTVRLIRDIERIYAALKAQAGARPLAQSKSDLTAIYNARHEIYERIADISADNNSSPEQTVQYIMEELSKCGY